MKNAWIVPSWGVVSSSSDNRKLIAPRGGWHRVASRVYDKMGIRMWGHEVKGWDGRGGPSIRCTNHHAWILQGVQSWVQIGVVCDCGVCPRGRAVGG
eukprot:755282-Hanusia_phi.AAC.1